MPPVNKSIFSSLSSPELEQLMASFSQISPELSSLVQKPQAVVPNAPGVNANADTTIGYDTPINPYLSPKSGDVSILKNSEHPYNFPAPTAPINPEPGLFSKIGTGVSGFLDRLSEGSIAPSEEQIIRSLQLNPISTPESVAKLSTMLENQTRQQVAAAKRAEDNQYKIDTGRLDPKSPEFKDFNDLVGTKAQLKYLLPQVNKAISDNDTNAISLLGNQIAAIASVANKQGVVNGEEVDRVLGSIQAASRQINAGQWTPQSSIKLGRELWGGLNKFGELVNGGLNAKLQRYQNSYIIPESFFQRSGINIYDKPEDVSGSIITPEEQDKATARATVFDTVKRASTTGEAIPKATLGVLDTIFNVGGFNSNLSNTYTGPQDNKKIEEIIGQYYRNENKLYENKVNDTNLMKRAGELIDKGDVEGLKKLLGSSSTTTSHKAPKVDSQTKPGSVVPPAK